MHKPAHSIISTSKQSITITRREWTGVFIFALFLAVATTLPYLLAWRRPGADWTFNGFLFGIEDGNAYLGKMRLGARGHWQFFLFYTAEGHQQAGLFYLPYIIAGQLVRLLVDKNDPRLFSVLVMVFHGLRVGIGLALTLVIYRFIAVFLPSAATRFLALILATFGGGFGWLLLFGRIEGLSSLPPEFYIPEGFSLLALLGLPHILLARLALFGGFLFLFKALQGESHRGWWYWSLWAGVCWIVVGLCVSFYFVIVYALMGMWGLTTWLHQKSFPRTLAIRGAVPVASTLPLFAYYLITFTRNAAFARWSSQNLLPSPPAFHYILAYGLLAGLAWVGGYGAWKRQQETPYMLLVGWVLAVPMLVYLPINVQRRMAEGVLVPLAILAAAGTRRLVLPLATWWHKPPSRVWRQLRQSTILITSLSSTLFLVGMYLTGLNHELPVFRSRSELAALDWLNGYARENEVVLSAKRTGNLIPARTNLRVFLGHDVETLHARAKEKQVEAFYRNELSPDSRGQFLARYHIRYIFYGPQERQLARTEDASPEWVTSLQLIYDYAGYQIYEVTD